MSFVQRRFLAIGNSFITDTDVVAAEQLVERRCSSVPASARLLSEAVLSRTESLRDQELAATGPGAFPDTDSEFEAPLPPRRARTYGGALVQLAPPTLDTGLASSAAVAGTVIRGALCSHPTH